MTSRLSENIMSVQEFGRALGIGREAIRRLRKRGMPILRIGGRTRISVPTAVDWITQNCLVSAASAGKDPLEGRGKNLGRRQNQGGHGRRQER